MSIDFDGGALQTQHDDDEYDKEDYAREQELQQLLTDLPHDMLDDSLCSSSEANFSDCSDHDLSEQHPHWNPKDHWDKHEGMSSHQNYQDGYSDQTNSAQYMGLQNGPPRNQEVEEEIPNGWGALNRGKGENHFHNKYSYPKEPANNDSNVGSFHSDGHYDGPDHCSTSELYHLPEDFQPYTNNGHQMGEGFSEDKHEQFQMFPASEGNGHQISEPIQMKYNPYQINGIRKDASSQDPPRRDDNYGDLQREFLDTGECTSNNMQFVQLQVLYKARGRQLEELTTKLEESERQLRYLSHQLTIVKDEKDGAILSIQESQSLLQNAKEVELQLRGQITALERTVDGLTTNDEQLRKELKVSKLAMDSMQQQVMDLRRSDSIHRAREQHEAVVSMLKKKNEEQLLSLQQKLDEVNAALTEQNEICSRLEQRLKQSERTQEEIKLEKTDIINRLTRSLEESQKQCANLLHTGSIQETTQLRMQLQQLQSSKLISDGMNKALQVEIKELKEQITMYESAAKLGVFVGGEEEQELSDSYVDLGIRKVNWQKSRFNRVMPTNGLRKDLSSEEVIMELKAELERSFCSNKAKRQQIVQLQSDLKGYQLKTEELKKLLESAENETKDCKASSNNFDRRLDSTSPPRPVADTDQEIQRLQLEKQQLQQEIEKHLLCIKELATNEEKLKAANQQLCSQMRQMFEDFDKDKKESIDRCERTYEQHHEDIKNHIRMELSEIFEAEKQYQCRAYEAEIANLQSRITELTNEMTAVQECYIAVCKEKDALEDNLRDSIKKEYQQSEEKWKEKLQDMEKSAQTQTMELELKHQASLFDVKAQWEKERECTIKEQLELAKGSWIKEQEKESKLRIQELENQWRQKLDREVQEVREKSLQNLEDHAIQTEETSTTQSTLEAERLDELKLQLHNAVQEKERAIREAQLDLETRHREDISKQVEFALTKAHKRWLEELTSLSEYKANLRLEREKWERLHDLNIKKQISDAAAEENWKLSAGKGAYSKNVKELEEQVASLKRELERKNEEFEAQMKVELGEARALWSKDRQDEIQQIQAQNENDYRTFLNEHKNKISEVLSAVKADFAKQKNELVSQKEEEVTEMFNRQLKQRLCEESLRIQDHDKEILSEIERIMSDIHDELVEKRVLDGLSSTSSNLDAQFLNKLRYGVQKSVKGIVYKAISNAKSKWKQKPDENFANREPKVSISAQDRSYIRNTEGTPKSHKKNLSEKLTNEDWLTTKGNNAERCCCENCLQQLQRYKKDCQELRGKLDKACRHLQQAVKDQKLKAEQFKNHEIVAQTLRKENAELHKTLEEMKSNGTSQCSQQDESSEKGCALCKGNALEEMRAQYIKAVDKIKNDMLRYIHESKGRAAEMLKNEVLRERQETARKMRKYYLTCLQQLLKDDGKNEGAEKKIMNAASKLATMAKVLETPISQKTQSRNLRLGLAVNQDGTEPETIKPLKNVLRCSSDRSTDPSTEQKTLDELIRRHMKEKLDGGRFPNGEDSAAIKHEVLQQYGMDCVEHKPPPARAGRPMSTPFDDGHDLNSPNTNVDSLQVAFYKQSEPSVLHGLRDRSCHGNPKCRSDRQKFELQETPVRDENGSNDWSGLNSKGPFLTRTTQIPLTNSKAQSQNPNTPVNVTGAGLFSFVEGNHDTFGSRYEGQNHSAHIVKKRDQTPSTQHPSKVMGHPPTAVESKPYSDVGRGSQLPSRKLLLDFATPQQDSGFDSPLPI
ncbi:centrosomal protein of 152 kDa [Bufo gargarizans]|uniref:centrosomal protein of 152 kDa n=1 Tax=Bufo gargarizans TaxID=30331 RepID=UPI001CF4909C|nr:centrosomal protein of 152 kDa [Bufo gargarizans]XP_044135561.1 centrosomal protein of 152 kDa [Bufo gargarizans]XP_044135562.1 centrosomal protein of 152 kDa [Bufo gargarizans]XP_044135563.1 centrosomal protein of 152 kDa [Bufo gargarizans]